jgi:diphthine synthase
MLYIIGLGLNIESMSLEGRACIEKCSKVYVEGYTVEFPYSFDELEKTLNTHIHILKREAVEGDFLEEAQNTNIGLLVYGSPLFATTHISLINDARKKNIKVKIVYAASVFDALAESGLQLYSFGKVASMPAWKKGYEPDSFIDTIVKNNSIDAHSLVLIDIGVDFKVGIAQFLEACTRKNLECKKMLVGSQAGSKCAQFYYGSIDTLKNLDVKAPYCFVIPGKLHFLEEEMLHSYTI